MAKFNKFTVLGWTKFAEVDVYSEGCLPHTGFQCGGNDIFTGENVDQVLNQIAKFLDAEREDFEFDACDEEGRIDVLIIENDEGYKATNGEIRDWKKGKIKLWSAVYTFQLLETKPVSLVEYNKGTKYGHELKNQESCKAS